MIGRVIYTLSPTSSQRKRKALLLGVASKDFLRKWILKKM